MARAVRSSIERADFNQSASGWLGLEIVAIATVLGLAYGWLAFGAVLIGLFVLALSRWALGLVWVLALAWACLGGLVGMLGGPVLAVLLGFVALCIGFAVNHGAVQYVRDLGSGPHMEL